MMVGVRWAVGRALERPAVPCDLLRAGLDAEQDGLALISADTRMTWRALDDLSGRLAGNLLALGLEPGDRVASLMPNRPALVVHYLACFKAGLVATPLNYRYMAPEIDHALQVSKAARCSRTRSAGRISPPAISPGTCRWGESATGRGTDKVRRSRISSRETSLQHSSRLLRRRLLPSSFSRRAAPDARKG
jgi:long-chain acyl-CoA synthetase